MLNALLDGEMWWRQLQGFLQQGGPVLSLILICTFFLWLLVLERCLHFGLKQLKLNQKIVGNWQKRKDQHSWNALQIKRRWFSLAKVQATKNLSTINVIVAIAPLLGLLGTVVGMVTVFDVMAITGSSNARAMAEGVSKATIPTMAGMVVSLLGLLFSTLLQRKAASCMDELAQNLSNASYER